MPMYEYECKECGNQFEELRKMEEMDKPLACPKCRSENTKRRLSAFGVSTPSGGGFSMPSCSGG